MAIGNWDALVFDHTGKSSSGSFVSPLGIQVDFYKNWLYVKDKMGWIDGGRFISPTVMQVHEGNLVYKDVNILALRGPQYGIYAAVWSDDYLSSCQGMIGCGVYGFCEDEWVGVKLESIQWFQKTIISVMSKTYDWGTFESFVHNIPNEFRWALLFNKEG